ncbi:MAG: 1-(5-phosphoribosyl)-5-[(5-phosphoribosylamino)methylideneamino]imidazole-4-carboxamide isomerase [Epulopiscium sp. Nuni2H_MBin003]|nr:MAG: 1-(5-phosphoribosyl)-5-[(5-phosphoribosylamino)methylideneamino]imidazole-4-carboxamide isomerase [Epulopiscium sp. Nuni2H_MBin003]
MRIFPAIDLKDNQIVRLSQGDYNKVKVYSDSISETLQSFCEAGADSLHIVDLDGAKEGALANQGAVFEILENKKFFCQLGGGMRNEYIISRALELGIDRVILGTIAVQNPTFVEEMVKKYGNKIAVGVDAKDGKVAINGWLEKSTLEAYEFCERLVNMGVETIIYTEISRDGMLNGCDIEAYKKLVQIKGLNIVASGGVSTLDEVKKLKEMGCDGAIVGKAIYEGKLSLKEVIDIC